MLPCTWETRHTGGFREVWPTAIKRRIAIVDPPTSGKVTADVNQPTRPVLTSPRALLPSTTRHESQGTSCHSFLRTPDQTANTKLWQINISNVATNLLSV
ncbi:hypothetical protein BHE74_00022569 [Ensete ventricosum]|nr:hypothetical protein BHE74_00022569 [Ensete ventricosum]